MSESDGDECVGFRITCWSFRLLFDRGGCCFLVFLDKNFQKLHVMAVRSSGKVIDPKELSKDKK
jgi:hypothetical protein